MSEETEKAIQVGKDVGCICDLQAVCMLCIDKRLRATAEAMIPKRKIIRAEWYQYNQHDLDKAEAKARAEGRAEAWEKITKLLEEKLPNSMTLHRLEKLTSQEKKE